MGSRDVPMVTPGIFEFFSKFFLKRCKHLHFLVPKRFVI